jgi:uncharacterized RDD family membrane protein YckC
MIDLLVWLAIGLAVRAAVVGVGGYGPDDLAEVSNTRGAVNGMLIAVLITAYEVVLVGARRATLGKLALGLEVSTLTGADVTVVTALRRMAHYLVLSLLVAVLGPNGLVFYLMLVVIAIVSAVFVFSDPKRQAVWDKIAGTTVISVR